MLYLYANIHKYYMHINEKRIIGERAGTLPGPLLIIFAEIHGNEPAGYLAIEELFEAIIRLLILEV